MKERQKPYIKLYNKLKNLDWKNPRIILTTIAILMFPLVAKYLVLSGLLLGLLLAVAILWLLDKCPNFVRAWCVDYPLISDLALSTLAITTLGGFFGSGLTLGLGAVFCGLFLSWALTEVRVDPVTC